MISNYDENIRDNAFFQRLLNEHYETVKRNYQKDLVICVPKASSLDPDSTAQCDLLDYILISNNNNSYTSMNDDIATIVDEVFILGTNEAIKVLFDETFYEKNKIKYKVLCIESYITRMEASQRCSSPNLVTTTDCIDFLWSEKNESNIVKKINTMVRDFLAQQDDLLELKALSSLKEISLKLYEDSVAISIKYLSPKKCAKEISKIKIAVETCMQYCCESKIFDAVATYVAIKDSVLNKIIRNVQHVPLNDFNINTQFYNHLVTIKLELSKINKFYTVLEKVNCLKRTFELLTKNVGNVTASDFLQVLVYLLVKLHVNNWYANLYFLMHFHFSTSEESGQYNFLIASLEAAIEYIKNGNVQASVPKKSLEHLFDQISLGNLERVKSILNNEKNVGGETKLDLCHPLCSCDKCELVLSEFKEKNCCTVSSIDEAGRGPLHIACISGNPLVVEYLLQKIKDVDQVDHLGCTPSLYASSRGHQPALLLLLYSQANLNASDNDGNTLLHLAANNGHEHCVKALLYYTELSGQPAAVNAANNYGDTALHHASKWGYTAIVNLLLQHNAIVDLHNRKKLTPLDVAHNYYVRQLLLHYLQMQQLERKNIWQKIVAPKRSMSLDTCTLQSTRPKNLDQYKKIDLLLASIEQNDMPLTCYYLGIPSSEDHKPRTSNSAVCHPLCDCDNCGASSPTPKNLDKSDTLNINVSNVDGNTALHIAAKYGRCEILRLLLDAGADVNVVARKSGFTPLHLACQNQRVAVVRELIKCGGCKLDVKDNEGNTPLYYACITDQIRVVEVLLQEGASAKVRNDAGKTAEEVASEMMMFGVLKVLQKNF